MKIIQISSLINASNYAVKDYGDYGIKSIKFNEAGTGSLTVTYDYSTYELEYKNGDILIVPAKNFTAYYAKEA